MKQNLSFLTENRVNNTAISEASRINNFLEFHAQLGNNERETQAKRCMRCGVPFCQSGIAIKGITLGCPLHNYIPEWNELLANNNIAAAYERLALTSPFPEFTSRVCPALCEAFCTCNINGDPVTVRENELFIIEEAFRLGLVKPTIPSKRTNFQIGVIGSGPAGLALANKLNQLGHNVTVYDKQSSFGGLLRNGIPNMKLDKNIIERRLDLLKQSGISFVANFDAKESVKFLQEKYDALAFATGAAVPRKLGVKGEEDKRIIFAVDFLTEITNRFEKNELANNQYKGKRFLVIGGGDTGNDCIGSLVRLKVGNITQLEIMPKKPRVRTNAWPEWPNNQKEDYGYKEALYYYDRDIRLFSKTITQIESIENELIIHLGNTTFKNGKLEIIPTNEVINVDYVIVACGFLGSDNELAKKYGLLLDKRNNFFTNDYLANENIFIAGDARTGQSLVVKAINDGQLCAAKIDKYLQKKNA